MPASSPFKNSVIKLYCLQFSQAKPEQKEDPPAKEVPDVIPDVKLQLADPAPITPEAPSVKGLEKLLPEVKNFGRTGWPSFLRRESKPATRANPTVTDYDKIDFNCSKKNDRGKRANHVLSSWNVDGVRAWIGKNCTTYIEHEKPDVFCMQVALTLSF